jgi:2-polyprenyl-3-methyl-5-hydroxy-6-metoxy-1,4-benzoquinol methylase/tetratricopeptide (TPR) repeat protein
MADANGLFAEAQALHRAGHQAEARQAYQQVLLAAPRHGGALHMLGIMAFQAGETEQALMLLTRAAAADPDVPSLHANLGIVLTAAGRLADAEASHLKALALRPGDANTLAALAVLALTRGDSDAALQRAVAALAAADNAGTRRLFADIAGALRFDKDDPAVRALLTRAIAEAWGAPAPLAQAATGLVRARLAADGHVEDDALLRAALAVAPVTDAVLEEALTVARRGLLDGGGDAAFAAALAQQCFLNGYIFWQDDSENARVVTLRARIEALLAAGASVPDAELAALACYLPLNTLANVEKITATPALAALLRQQRDEPAEERRLAAALPALTPIEAPHDTGELYPRWSGTPTAEMPVSPRAYLVSRFPAADLNTLPDKPDMLVAGCGTGQYALQLARSLTLGDVTAIDLDRAVLGYAARKALEAGMGHLRFGQGDVLQVAALQRQFGLIECGGVLHQLADPLAGWAALLAVLEPGGLMRVAVHSSVAQAGFANVRALVTAQGFTATPDGIRAARQWLKQQHDTHLTAVLDAAVFFTQGGCRHLLFPVAEHPLSFREIAAFLDHHGLTLLGLDVAAPVLAAYRARFPQDALAADLDNWAAFEQENPDTFAAMIQFWVQKRG